MPACPRAAPCRRTRRMSLRHSRNSPMSSRRILLYFAWCRPAETGAPLAVIDDRFPAVFELRRLFYPKFEGLADRRSVDQGIAGFLDHIQKPNFRAFAELAEALSGRPAILVERVGDDGAEA